MGVSPDGAGVYVLQLVPGSARSDEAGAPSVQAPVCYMAGMAVATATAAAAAAESAGAAVTPQSVTLNPVPTLVSPETCTPDYSPPVDPPPGGSIGAAAAGSTGERWYPRRYLSIAATVTVLLLSLLKVCTASTVSVPYVMLHAKPGSMAASLHFPSAQSAFDLANVNVTLYPLRIVSLPFDAMRTGLGIAHAVHAHARLMPNSSMSYWHASKDTLDLSICNSALFSLYTASSTTLLRLLHTDYAGDTHTRRSNTGYVFAMHVDDVACSFLLHSSVVVSVSEVEHVYYSVAL